MNDEDKNGHRINPPPMTYSQLREEIKKLVIGSEGGIATNDIMTAIDTYLEKKAVEVTEMKLIEAAVNPEMLMWKQRINGYIEKAAAIIRSKE